MDLLRVLIAACVLTFVCVVSINNRPIVGVLTQDCPFKTGSQYIAAGYVKWLEAAGARVVPLKYDMKGLSETLKHINGVLLPGGSQSMTGKYGEALKTIFQHSLKSYDEGNPFPLWGTCLGFEELVCLAAQSTSVLDGSYDSENLPLPLKLESGAQKSRFFANMPDSMIKVIQTKNVTYNNHAHGVKPDKFSSNSVLGKFFNVLSTNTDRKGKKFVSTIEGRVYPIWGTQWHPEKVSFEWNENLSILHTSESVAINMYPVTFFVDQCRQNKNKYPTKTAEESDLIYNFKMEPTYKTTHFEQCYFF